MVHLLFEDKRLTIIVLIAWMSFSLILLKVMTDENGSVAFMHIGPSKSLKLMDLTVDTWSKWLCVSLFTFFNTAISEFINTSLVPFFQNTIEDHKNTYLPYSKSTCWIIAQTFCVYCHIMSVFGIFLIFSQVDFLMVRACADLFVNGYTTTNFLKTKIYDPEKYRNIQTHDHKSLLEIDPEEKPSNYLETQNQKTDSAAI